MENGIPIKNWYSDKSDRELYNLSPILEFLAYTNDVRDYIKKFTFNNEVNYKAAQNLISSQDENKWNKNYYMNKNVNKEYAFDNSYTYSQKPNVNLETPNMKKVGLSDSRGTPQNINISIVNTSMNHFYLNNKESKETPKRTTDYDDYYTRKNDKLSSTDYFNNNYMKVKEDINALNQKSSYTSSSSNNKLVKQNTNSNINSFRGYSGPGNTQYNLDKNYIDDDRLKLSSSSLTASKFNTQRPSSVVAIANKSSDKKISSYNNYNTSYSNTSTGFNLERKPSTQSLSTTQRSVSKTPHNNYNKFSSSSNNYNSKIQPGMTSSLSNTDLEINNLKLNSSSRPLSSVDRKYNSSNGVNNVVRLYNAEIGPNTYNSSKKGHNNISLNKNISLSPKDSFTDLNRNSFIRSSNIGSSLNDNKKTNYNTIHSLRNTSSNNYKSSQYYSEEVNNSRYSYNPSGIYILIFS